MNVLIVVIPLMENSPEIYVPNADLLIGNVVNAGSS